MSNEVELVIKATDKTADGVQASAKHVRSVGSAVDDTAARQRKAAAVTIGTLLPSDVLPC